MKSNEEIVGQLSKQVNLGQEVDVAFCVLKRKDAEIAKEKELLKKDLFWEISRDITIKELTVEELKKANETMKSLQHRIDTIVDDHFPQNKED